MCSTSVIAFRKTPTLVVLSLSCLLFGSVTPTAGEQEPSTSHVLDASNLRLPVLIREATPPAPPANPRERFLTYAYRTGEVDALLSAVDSLIAENQLSAGASGELLHFFAAALKGRPDAVEELTKREVLASGEVKAALATIIRAAADFSSPAPASPAAIDALWAEYRALGSEETLKAIVSVLKLPLSGESEELVRHAVLSLARNVPVHGNLTFLERSLREASGGQRVLLRLVFDAVSDRKDTADRLTRMGDNLHAEGKNQEAVAQYLAALSEYPAHHPTHTTMGRYFEKTGDIPKALWHAEQALLLAGDDPYVLTNLSRVLYRLRRYADAQRSCEKALANNPSDAYPHYLLGLILEALNERGKAAVCFARSLEIEPHGSCSGDARRHLAGMNASVPVSATDLVLLLRQKNYAEIEQQLAGLLESGEKTRDGTSRIYEAYDQIATVPRSDAAYQARLKELEAWLAARPDSHFAYSCLGEFYLEYAFFSRGSGWASSVTADGRKLLQERLLEAQTHLEKAYELDPSDPAPPASLIRVAMGLCWGSTRSTSSSNGQLLRTRRSARSISARWTTSPRTGTGRPRRCSPSPGSRPRTRLPAASSRES